MGGEGRLLEEEGQRDWSPPFCGVKVMPLPLTTLNQCLSLHSIGDPHFTHSVASTMLAQ